MALGKFEHVLIMARDLEATKAFYTDVLGLSVGPRPEFPFPGYWLYLGDTPCLHLSTATTGQGAQDYLNRGDATGTGSGAIDHIAFVCDDLDGMRAQLDAKGMDQRHREVPNMALHQIFVKDPDGITVELNFPQ